MNHKTERDEALAKWQRECEGGSVPVTPMMRHAYRDGWDDALAGQSAGVPEGEYRRMFEDAVRSLAAIDEALGIDPDEAGGAAPILEAIAELKRERDEWIDANYGADAQADERWAWRTGAPPVAEGKCREFIIAVRRAQSNPPGKVFVFSASYANKFTDDGCLSGRDGDEFVAEGWHLCGLDMSGEFNEVYEPIGLNEGDEIVGWREFPKWQEALATAPAPVSAPAPDREQATLCEDGGKCGIGGYCGQCEKVRAASEPEQPPAENAAVRNKIAAALHYPDHWDDTAYPTLDHAAWEAIAAAKLTCSECAEQPIERGEQECPHGVDDGACKQCYRETVQEAQGAAFDEIRDALDETYGFASTSPRGQENINFALGKLDEIEQYYANLARPPAASAPTLCVGCEGNPAPQNSPCAVCGQPKAAEPKGCPRCTSSTAAGCNDIGCGYLDAGSGEPNSAEPKGMTDWREKCAALVDIYDDAKNNEPENRCYVDGAFRQEIDELRALLANGE